MSSGIGCRLTKQVAELPDGREGFFEKCALAWIGFTGERPQEIVLPVWIGYLFCHCSSLDLSVNFLVWLVGIDYIHVPENLVCRIPLSGVPIPSPASKIGCMFPVSPTWFDDVQSLDEISSVQDG